MPNITIGLVLNTTMPRRSPLIAAPSIALATGPGTAGTLLVATQGLWDSGIPTGQWYADDLPVSGATGLFLTLTPDIERASIDYRETLGESVARSNTIAFPNRYMFFATRARMPSGSLHTVIAGTEYKCCKIVVSTPSYPVNDFRFHFSGFASTEGGNSPQETVVPSGSIMIDRVVMRVGGVTHGLTFSGAAGVTIASAALGAWADALVLDQAVAPESDIEIWTFYHNAAGATQVPVYRIQTHRGERIWGGSTLASVEAYLATPLAASHPSLDVRYTVIGNDTTGQPQFYGPDFMVAKGWDGRPVALCAVDSIGEARQEVSASADARGNLGWLRRWLDTKGGIGRIPHLMIGMPGAAAYRELTGSGTTIATRRWDVLDQITAFNDGQRPFTVAINQLDQNDTNSSYATWFSRMTGFVGRLRARYSGIKVVAFTPLGRTDASDGYRTTAGQSFAAQNTYPADTTDASGKWRLRNDILAKTGACCDEAIDTFAAWSSPNAPGKWRGAFDLPQLGTLIGAHGDGVTPVAQFRVTQPIRPEQTIAIEYLPDTYSSRTVLSCDANGDGSYTATIVPVTWLTAFMDGGRIYEVPTTDGVHPQTGEVARIAAGVLQGEKAKLAV